MRLLSYKGKMCTLSLPGQVFRGRPRAPDGGSSPSANCGGESQGKLSRFPQSNTTWTLSIPYLSLPSPTNLGHHLVWGLGPKPFRMMPEVARFMVFAQKI